jgi:uncharacterized membrane protein (UPF0127 family)
MNRVLRFDLSRRLAVLAGIALACVSLAGVADISFRTTRIKVGPHPLTVQVAENEAQREHGLMFRPKLGPNEGMLFVFEQPGYYSMWMKDTLIALSVAFVDREGRILNILDMEPRTLDTHTAAGPALFAVETNRGWFAEHHVKAGDRVTGLPRPAP